MYTSSHGTLTQGATQWRSKLLLLLKWYNIQQALYKKVSFTKLLFWINSFVFFFKKKVNALCCTYLYSRCCLDWALFNTLLSSLNWEKFLTGIRSKSRCLRLVLFLAKNTAWWGSAKWEHRLLMAFVCLSFLMVLQVPGGSCSLLLRCQLSSLPHPPDR